MKRRILVHRYDNEKDILAVESFGFSDVYDRSRDDSFEYVLVIPTGRAGTATCVIGEALTSQLTPDPQVKWPGRPDSYNIRVKMKNFKYTTVDRVRAALLRANKVWAAQWRVAVVELELDELKLTAQPEPEPRRPV